MKRNKDTYLSAQKGASSVLVIFMMIILAVLSTLVLTSAMANQALEKRAYQWVNSYYALQNDAKDKLMKIDVKLADAELAARTVVMGTATPENTAVLTSAGLGKAERSKAYFEKAYIALAQNKLEALAAENPDISIERKDMIIEISGNVGDSKTPGGKNLQYELQIRPLAYEIDETDYWNATEKNYQGTHLSISNASPSEV